MWSFHVIIPPLPHLAVFPLLQMLDFLCVKIYRHHVMMRDRPGFVEQEFKMAVNFRINCYLRKRRYYENRLIFNHMRDRGKVVTFINSLVYC